MTASFFSTSAEVHRSDHGCLPEKVSPIHQAPGGRLEYSDPFFRSKGSASRNAPRTSPNCRSQPLLTIIWHESIRPSVDTVGDCVAPLPASSMTSGSKYPRRHHRALNSSGPGRVTTKRLGVKRSPNCALAFSALAPDKNAQVSSTQYFWLPKSRISRARVNSFHSLFWQLLATIALLSLLAALQSRQSIPQEFHCHAPQVRTTESRRHRLQWRRQRQTLFTSFTSALFLLLFFVIDIQTAFFTRDLTKELQPAPLHALSSTDGRGGFLEMSRYFGST